MGGGYPELLRVLQECQRMVANNQVNLPICEFLHMMNCDRQQHDTFGLIAQRWKNFSGDYLYPVPAPAGIASVSSARGIFHAATYTKSFWEGEYGDNRKALLAWAIHYMEEAGSGKVIVYGPDGWGFRPPEVCEGRVEPVISRNEGLSFRVDGTPIIYRRKEP